MKISSILICMLVLIVVPYFILVLGVIAGAEEAVDSTKEIVKDCINELKPKRSITRNYQEWRNK